MDFYRAKPATCLIGSLNILLGTKFELAHKADDFADEYFIGPFVVSYDVVNDWLLFLNHKQYRYIHIADLNRLASITKLILNGDIRIASSFLLADMLDRIGVVVSRGRWTIGPVHICCDDTEGWLWEMQTDIQHTWTE